MTLNLSQMNICICGSRLMIVKRPEGIILSLFTAVIFIIVIYHYSYSFFIIGDTEEYQFNFLQIESNPYPYGIEFIMPIVMSLIRYIGGDFRDFIFFSLTLWVPIVCWFAYLSVRKPIFLLTVFFFSSPWFIDNAAFLIRQYYAAYFFLFFIFSEKTSNKVLFFLLSVFSHLSSIIWLLGYTIIFIRIAKRKKILVTIFIFSMACFFISSQVFSLFIQLVNTISTYGLPDVFARKIAFYNSDMNSVQVGLFRMSLSLIILTISFLILYLINLDEKKMNFISFIFFNASFFLMFSWNIVSASRLGFWSYYFSVPILCFLINYILELTPKKRSV